MRTFECSSSVFNVLTNIVYDKWLEVSMISFSSSDIKLELFWIID